MSTPFELVKKLRPHAATIDVLTQGHMNEMIVVDHQEIFRFPTNEESRQRLRYEAYVLDALDGRLSIAMPKLLHHDHEEGYSILSYIPGKVLATGDIQSFDDERRQVFAEKISQVMREVNNLLDVGTMQRVYEEKIIGLGTWDEYYDGMLTNEVALKSRYFDNYKHYRDRVRLRRAQLTDAPRIVIHGDLHAGNLIFDEDEKLVGVIDFGDCEVGTIYNELRPLMSLGEPLVRDVIKMLDGALGDVDFALLRDWAIMHELSVMVREEHPGPRQTIARQFLTGVLGEGWEDMRPVRAVIFDCFGVLVREKWLDFRDEHFADNPAVFAQVNAMMHRVSLGAMSTKKFISEISAMTAVDYDSLDVLLHDNPSNDRLLDYIAGLKGAYRIGILSNVGQNRLHEMFSEQQLALFDDFALSSEMGYAKPDRQAYETAAARLGVAPEQCVFVDDRQRFCEAAEAVGMHAVRYESFAQCTAELDGVLRRATHS